MTGAQTNGVKRKGFRHVLDPDDGAPPPKKTRSQAAARPASQPSVKTRSARGEPPPSRAAAPDATPLTLWPAAYDEDDDGFSFSRTRSKRAKTSNASAPAPPPAESQPRPQPPTDDGAPDEPVPPPKRRPRKTLPVTPERDAPRRRSKRLSGTSPTITPGAETTPPPETKKKKKQKKKNADSTPPPPSNPAPRDLTPPPDEDGDLTVQKKRTPAKIPLPFGETPVLRRNKEMRKLSAEKSRRSSSGMRGRRASSLIENGTSRAVPHSEVETPDFYKHISQDLVEPKRMRQLLTWCAQRALPEKGGGQMDAAETAAMHAARVIQEELLAEFGTRGDMSYWYDREDTAPAVLVKKPNPRNVQNAEKLPQLEAELARLQEEKRGWEALLASTSKKPEEPGTMVAQPPMTLQASSIDTTLLEPSQTSALQTLLSTMDISGGAPQPSTTTTTTTTTAESTQQRMAAAALKLEFKIDRLADAAHRVEQYRLTAERLADSVLGAGARKLDERAAKLSEKTGSAVDPMDRLRGLSRVLGRGDRSG